MTEGTGVMEGDWWWCGNGGGDGGMAVVEAGDRGGLV